MNEQQNIVTTKRISWSYPTSSNATKFGFMDGCWTVSIATYVDGAEKPEKDAVVAFELFHEAVAYAKSMPEPFDKYSVAEK